MYEHRGQHGTTATPRAAAAVGTPRRLLRAVFWAASVLVGAHFASSMPAAGQYIPSDVPAPIRGLELQDKRGRQLPLDLTFTDSTGKQITVGDLFPLARLTPGTAEYAKVRETAKPVVLVMMYFRCPLQCPMVLDKFTQTLNAFEDLSVGTDYNAVMVSFDTRDTVADASLQKSAQLLAYARPTTDEVRNGWSFLVSSAENAKALAESIGFPYRWLPQADEFAHPNVVFVVTPEGTVSRYLTGLSYPPRDVRLALVEAADGRIGTVFDSWTLWCYHFDPASGSYTLQAFRVMQGASAIGTLALGTFVFTLFRFERRKRARLIAEAASHRAESSQVVAVSDVVRAALPVPTLPATATLFVGSGPGVGPGAIEIAGGGRWKR